MKLQWIGAILIIVGCGGVGFGMVLNYKREEAALKQLLKALTYMNCELEYRMTPLPDLCRKVSDFSTGCIRAVFLKLAKELEAQIAPDARCCMKAVLKAVPELPQKAVTGLAELGDSLGQFDLNGQLKGVDAVIQNCEKELRNLEANRSERLRSYQTLGLCAGAALAILFI